jgi:CBS domain containing-hemolysin-like protein
LPSLHELVQSNHIGFFLVDIICNLTIQVVQAMARDCVKVHATATVKETLGAVVAARQDCALVVDENGLLEGILTPSDLQGKVLRATEEFDSSEEASNVEVFKIIQVAEV